MKRCFYPLVALARMIFIVLMLLVLRLTGARVTG